MISRRGGYDKVWRLGGQRTREAGLAGLLHLLVVDERLQRNHGVGDPELGVEKLRQRRLAPSLAGQKLLAGEGLGELGGDLDGPLVGDQGLGNLLVDLIEYADVEPHLWHRLVHLCGAEEVLEGLRVQLRHAVHHSQRPQEQCASLVPHHRPTERLLRLWQLLCSQKNAALYIVAVAVGLLEGDSLANVIEGGDVLAHQELTPGDVLESTAVLFVHVQRSLVRPKRLAVFLSLDVTDAHLYQYVDATIDGRGAAALEGGKLEVVDGLLQLVCLPEYHRELVQDLALLGEVGRQFQHGHQRRNRIFIRFELHHLIGNKIPCRKGDRCRTRAEGPSRPAASTALSDRR